MNKGIVMEVSENSIIVMRADGRFDKLPRNSRGCEVGEEILYAEPHRRRKVPALAKISGLVAAVALCIVVFAGLYGTTANSEIVAYVSIDINPSVEMGIDSGEIVRDLKGLNSDGVDLIASLDYKGKKLVDVTAAILDKAEQGPLAKGEGDIIIASTIVQAAAKLDDQAIVQKLKQQVSEHIQVAHPNQVENYEVAAFSAPEEVRQQAMSNGISAGKFAVYLTALDNGTKLSLDDLKSESIHKLAKDNGGIRNLINSAKPADKAELKQLFEDERAGKLAAKAQKKKDDKDKYEKPVASSMPGKNDRTDNNKNRKNNDDDDDRTRGNNNRSNNNKDDRDDQNDESKVSAKPRNSKDDDKKDSTGKKDNRQTSPSSSPNPTEKPSTNPSTKKPAPSPKSDSKSDSDSRSRQKDDGKKDGSWNKDDSDAKNGSDKKESERKKNEDRNEKDND